MQLIIGIDEVGRGPIAGPVTAASVYLPDGFSHPDIKDSKQLSKQKRQQLAKIIQDAALYSIISIGPRRIEAINIREASRLAMRLSAYKLYLKLIEHYQHRGHISIRCLIDGNTDCGPLADLLGGAQFCVQEPIIKGDEKEQSIAAASIIAKVHRDLMMSVLDRKYQNYGLAHHQGYPTAYHMAQVRLLGPSRIHRKTFHGVKEFIDKKQT